MSLQVWLPLNGDLHNQGLFTSTISVSGTTVFSTEGKIGQCLSCNGSTFWTIPSFSIGAEVSICCWIKTSTNGKMPWVLESDANNKLNLYMSSVYTLNTGDSNNNPFQDDSNNSISVLTDGEWHHHIVTFGNNIAKLYIDGVYKGKAKTFRNPTTTNKNFRIAGGYNNGTHTYDFNGLINDMRVYNHCLSPKEVEEISKGLVLHYQLNDTINIKDTVNLLGQEKSEKFVNVWGSYGFSSTGVLSIANINPAISGETVLVTNNGDNGKAGEIATSFGNSIMNKGDSITVSAYVKGNGATIGKTGTIHMYNTNGTNTQSTGKQFTFTDKWQRVFYTLTWPYDNPSNASGNMYIYCPRNNGESFYVSNCQAERGTSPTVFTTNSRISNKIIYDSSGYNNNGVAVGNFTIDPISSKFNYSTKFNGNGNLIKITPFYFNTKDWTVSLWYYHPLAISSTWNSFICLSKDTGTDPNKKFALMFNNGNSNHLWCKVNSGSGRTFPIKTNVWTHLTLTSDGKVYENGILKTSSLSPGDNITGAYDLVIGSRAASANINTTFSEYTGNISDVRIYATALTEAQVKELYRTSMNIDGTNILPRDLE